MKYPKVTAKNFETFSNAHVNRGENLHFVNLHVPTNPQEFKEFTKNIYGVGLDVDCFAYPVGSFRSYDYSCNYKIKGKTQDEYAKNPIMKLWDKKYGQYDGLKILLNSCFGNLFCGGVAAYHYGQTSCSKEIWETVKKWNENNDVKVAENMIEQHNMLVEIFGGNPFLKPKGGY